MKKALIMLAISLVILFAIIGYDIVECDGNVIMKRIFKIESDYDSESYETEPQQFEFRERKLVNTSPDIVTSTVEEDKETAASGDDNETDEGTDDTVRVPDDDRGYEFYFPLLSEEEKNIYREAYNTFTAVETGSTIPTAEDEPMNRAILALKDDHPELFYLGEIGYTHYTLGGQVQRTTLSVTYTDTKAMIDTKRNMADAVAQGIISSIPSNADDYTKVKMVYEALIRDVDYNLNAPDNQTIISALVNKSSVCAGYSRSMQYILNKVGVPTTIVEGWSKETGEQHAWNLCKLEDGYYHVDVTWGDASYSSRKNDIAVNDINYDYLLVTTEEIERTHGIDSFAEIPRCDLTDNNYYVREGLMLTQYDENQIREIFSRGYEQGKKTVSFKCNTLETYDEVYRQLIRKSGVFDMLSNKDATITYVTDENQRTLCFWL